MSPFRISFAPPSLKLEKKKTKDVSEMKCSELIKLGEKQGYRFMRGGWVSLDGEGCVLGMALIAKHGSPELAYSVTLSPFMLQIIASELRLPRLLVKYIVCLYDAHILSANGCRRLLWLTGH